ncbi:MAG TPA: glycosyl hydrolase family 28-related protein, partial [Puia sp.]
MPFTKPVDPHALTKSRGQEFLQDTGRLNNTGTINVKDFGAKGDGVADDLIPIQKACNACIAYPATCTSVRLPVGNYRITQPLMLQKIQNGQYAFFTLRLTGDAPNKSASDSWLSRITYDSKSGFAIGVQLGRGITIENITLLGKYQFPYKVTNKNIGSLTFADWNDGSVTDNRNNPYAGIVIDPYANQNGSSAGTSGVEIKQCAVKQFMVGICLTPNPQTQNDEMINIIDDDIEAVRVAIAIGQDQSKEIHIDRLKCWAATHTILDGVSYG